ncbi:MAG TPA: alpha/beta hydrolase [Deltaproteobacteria bacterium]|nr:alpha/beta hydrolase [Deltaproteobacteria bacterium]HPR56019.1 alpha/beta hydrolase [Deltaproteobacteria bacterium]HXK46984.1 alpha/beta hydrolase [Deltaproteobacteria bacterium]
MHHTGSGSRLFRSQAFHYQALRTMGHSVASGANPGECLEAIRRIRDEDAESWYASWHAFGEKCEKMSVAEGDAVSRGMDLLRASNYYRASEFFLSPSDPRRLEAYRRSSGTFVRALQVLKIPHKLWKIPYDRVSLHAYYLPGDDDKPLILACGGYDSTLEELFFWIGKAARERGCPCIMFEGPGQSHMLREYGVKFTHEWEKPLKMLLDYAEWEAPELAKRRKVILGVSMGGMLALRAAARDKRIDAAACFGGFFNMREAALAQLPGLGRWLFRLGFEDVFNRLARLKAARDIGRRWALTNGCWSMGGQTPFELLVKTGDYSVAPVAEEITCNVLIVKGERDHLIPSSDSALFRKHITRARTYREHTFTAADGAGEHCQAGAVEQFHQVFFDWVEGLAAGRY